MVNFHSNVKHRLCQEYASAEKGQYDKGRRRTDSLRQGTPLDQQKFSREWKKAAECFMCPLWNTLTTEITKAKVMQCDVWMRRMQRRKDLKQV